MKSLCLKLKGCYTSIKRLKEGAVPTIHMGPEKKPYWADFDPNQPRKRVPPKRFNKKQSKTAVKRGPMKQLENVKIESNIKIEPETSDSDDDKMETIDEDGAPVKHR